ncbi:MAG: carbohydrate kinase family protein [Planctomycetaceae bacterium]
MQRTKAIAASGAEAWVAGEVLIDRIPDARGGRQSIVGGGSANTAKALARLGIKTCFIDGISTDEHGRAARAELQAAGVDLAHAPTSDKPTALAEVALDADGKASYVFSLAGTATFDFADSWLPRGAPTVLHVGTLATIVEPGCGVLHRWASNLSAHVVYDPNVRPSVLGDRAAYRAAVARWVTISDVVKFSADDLQWLYPESRGLPDMIDLARATLAHGPSLVAITRGESGIVGVTRDRVIEVPAVATTVIDTVGAGDTAGAILVEGIIDHGLAGLCGERLRDVLERAAQAAAITCSRAGAQPPWAGELRGLEAPAVRDAR